MEVLLLVWLFYSIPFISYSNILLVFLLFPFIFTSCKSLCFYIVLTLHSVQCSSVTQLCPSLCDPMNHSMPGLPVHHQLLEFTQTHVHRVGDAIQPFILCHPLLLLPSIFPSIRVFSKESTLYITCPKYWSFSFSTSPSNEYSLTSHNWTKNTTASCFMTSMHMLSHVMILTQSDLMQYRINNLT